MKKFLFIISTLILALMIGCRKLPDIGDGYRLEHNGMNDLQIENSHNTVVVNGRVSNYAFDSKFIVAAQRPRDSVPGIETMTARKYEKVFEESKIRKYWIIGLSIKQMIAFMGLLTKKFIYSNAKNWEYLKSLN